MTTPLLSFAQKLFGAGRAKVTQTAPVAQAAWSKLFLRQKEEEEEAERQRANNAEGISSIYFDAIGALQKRRAGRGHNHAVPIASEEMVAMRRDCAREAQTGRDLLRSSSLWRTTAAAAAASRPSSPPDQQQQRQHHDVVYQHAPPASRLDDSVYLAQ